MINNEPRTALITGASSGIGAAFARRLAAEGYDLVLVARRQERLAALAAELERQTTSEVLVADLSSRIDIKRVEERIAELETLEMLINNAGFAVVDEFAKKKIDKVLDMIEVHVIASVHFSRAALPGMIARGQGAIINVSSLAAFNPIAGNATYGATKAYLNFFSKCLHTELRGTGIRVQALCPGPTYTEITASRAKSRYSKAVPLMSAEEVVEKSLNALSRNQTIYIPGFRNRLIAAWFSVRSRSSILRNYQFRKILNWTLVFLNYWTLVSFDFATIFSGSEFFKTLYIV